jgi:hypothetical protein
MKLLLILLMFRAQLQSNPQETRGSVSGMVVRAGTTETVGQTHILLTKVGGTLSDSITTIAEANGTFLLPDIRAGQYRIFFQHDDYLRGEYGQSGVDAPGRPITVGAGQRISNLTLAIVPACVITGQILDDNGDPISRIYVRVLRAADTQSERKLVKVAERQTNDRGQYRIYELPAGKYFISAAPYQPPYIQQGRYIQPSPPGLNTFEGAGASPLASMLTTGRYVSPIVLESESLGETYYPGTIDAASAREIDLTPGRTLNGIGMALKRLHLSRVTGRLIDGRTGQPVSGSVTLWTGSQQTTTFPAGANPTFEFGSLAPGSYTVKATARGLQGSESFKIAENPSGTDPDLRILLYPGSGK